MTPDAAERRARALLDGHSLARDAAPDLARDVLALADALRTLAAQHAADVAAAVAGERARIAAECKRVVRENTRPWELAEEIADALAAQHAGDVAAAVAGERERAVAVCRAVADGWERASVTAKVDTGLALIRAEGATECADALAAPTGGGE